MMINIMWHHINPLYMRNNTWFNEFPYITVISYIRLQMNYAGTEVPGFWEQLTRNLRDIPDVVEVGLFTTDSS